MRWILMCFRKYAVFKGRSSRKEYWVFCFFAAIVAAILNLLTPVSEFFGVAFNLFVIAVSIPYVSATVRRLHDVGETGLKYFVVFIPIVGAFWLLLLTLRSSDPGENKYGPNPRLEKTSILKNKNSEIIDSEKQVNSIDSI